MLSPDGSYGDINYKGSGRQLSTRVLEIVRQRYPRAQIIEMDNELEATKKSNEQGANYLISPTILHWEDRLTVWSGFRDKVKVGLRFIRLSPYQVVSSNEFESRNNSLTFFNTHPQDLLGRNFEKAVLALFQ